MRLDRVLAERPEISSRALAERLIADGAALVDGERRPKSHRLGGGESVNVDIPAVLALVPEAMDLAILWEDEHLLVADKPAGLVVHPAGGARTGTLVHGLLELGAEGGDDDDRPGIVHRLDKDTSGLLVVARSDEAHAGLQDMIRKRELERRYLALVRGAPRSRIRPDRGSDRARPQESLAPFAGHGHRTRRRDVVRVHELLRDHTLLEVRLETGRTHQIRVHLEALGLPVAGDSVYGTAGDLGLARQFLHAHRLCFAHPLTGEQVDVSSPLPADLEAALQLARSL